MAKSKYAPETVANILDAIRETGAIALVGRRGQLVGTRFMNGSTVIPTFPTK
ncbi:MAG: hypothetical protein HC781_06475 [Leptolyngbyaceae cyanobacterium CSU_1_4]|nr:hypothetical protein [Leptolyngbyaceae cyanobacterium CSU_1_4]